MDKKGVFKKGDRVVVIKPISYQRFVPIPILTKGRIASIYKNTGTSHFFFTVKFDNGLIWAFPSEENCISKYYDMNDEINGILNDIYGSGLITI